MKTPNTSTPLNDKPSEESIKNKNKRLIEKVNLWQSVDFVRPLTCQKNGCGCKLQPKELKLKVILQCPECKSVQSYIPKSVIKTDIYIPAVLKRQSKKYNKFLDLMESTNDDSNNE